MNDKKGNILIDLEMRIRQVLVKCDVLQKQIAELKKERDLLNTQIEAAKEDQSRLKAKYDSLKMARTITVATENVDEARATLSKMVRKIDRCIHLLK